MRLHSWTKNKFGRFYSKWLLWQPATTFRGCHLDLSIDSIDTSISCSMIKQDLTLKQAHLVSFCFVLCNQPKFWQLTLVSSAFYRLYLEIVLFCTKPSAQISLCHMTDVTYYDWLIASSIGVFFLLLSFLFFFKVLFPRTCAVNTANTNSFQVHIQVHLWKIKSSREMPSSTNFKVFF